MRRECARVGRARFRCRSRARRGRQNSGRRGAVPERPAVARPLAAARRRRGREQQPATATAEPTTEAWGSSIVSRIVRETRWLNFSSSTAARYGQERRRGAGLPLAGGSCNPHLRPEKARGPEAGCRSSVVEHPLGKGEVVSSILTGSTTYSSKNLNKISVFSVLRAARLCYKGAQQCCSGLSVRCAD